MLGERKRRAWMGRGDLEVTRTLKTENTWLHPPGPPYPRYADGVASDSRRLSSHSWGAQGSKLKVWAGLAPPEAPRGSLLHASVLASGGPGLGVPCLAEAPANLRLLRLSVSSPLLKRTPVTGLRAQLIQYDLIFTSAKTLFVNKEPPSEVPCGGRGGHYPTQGNTFIPPNFHDTWILIL